MKYLSLTLFVIAAFLPLAKADRFEELAVEPVPSGLHLQNLATITADRDPRVANISIMLNDKNIAEGVYTKYVNTNRFNLFDMTRNVFWLKDVESRNGVVLFVERGLDALFLQGELDRETQEGVFVLKYLANGITSKYDSCKIRLKNNNGNFTLQNFYTNKRVTNVKVLTWSFGISTLDGVCPVKSKSENF